MSDDEIKRQAEEAERKRQEGVEAAAKQHVKDGKINILRTELARLQSELRVPESDIVKLQSEIKADENKESQIRMKIAETERKIAEELRT